MKKCRLFFMTLFVGAGLVACSNDDEDLSGNQQTARVAVELTDAPGDYDEVLIEVVDVRVKMEAEANMTGADEEGWISLENVRTGIYDLLELTGGKTELLADVVLPAGHLEEMRLVLGSNNDIIVNGTSYTLQTPSAEQSGLKLKVNQDLEAGEEYTFIMDFDVDKSVTRAGASGSYILKPVIRVSVKEQTGVIVGSVHPTTEQALVTAQSGTTTVSAYTNAEGEFYLHGMPEGTYRVTITPAVASGLPEVIKNDISVTAGGTTDLEVVFLN